MLQHRMFTGGKQNTVYNSKLAVPLFCTFIVILMFWGFFYIPVIESESHSSMEYYLLTKKVYDFMK